MIKAVLSDITEIPLSRPGKISLNKISITLLMDIE